MNHINKLKLIPRSTITAKSITRLVGQLEGGAGVTITKAAGIWTASLDVSGLGLVSSPVTVPDGGTGILSYAVGDLLYASSATTLAKLNAGTSGYALMANGAGVAPSYRGFTQDGIGAIIRPWVDKARERVNVDDFGADPTGAADSTSAIQAAVTHCIKYHKICVASAGRYLISDEIVFDGTASPLPGGPVGLEGEGVGVTFFDSTNDTSDDFVIDNTTYGFNGGSFGGFSFSHTTPKTAGYAIKQTSSSEPWQSFRIHNIEFTNTFGLITFDCTAYFIIEHLVVNSVGANQAVFDFDAPVGCLIHSFNVRDLLVRNGTGSTNTTAIRIGNRVGAGQFTSCQIQGGSPTNIDYGIDIVGTSTVDWIRFVDVYVDAMRKNAFRAAGGTNISFVAGGLMNSGNGYNGVEINGGQVAIRSSLIYGHQRSAIRISGGFDTFIDNNSIFGNGFESGGSNVHPDILVEDDVYDFNITNNKFKATPGAAPVGYTNSSNYNILVAGPDNDRYVITGNNATSGLTAGVLDNGTGRDKTVGFGAGTISPNGNVLTHPLLMYGSISGIANIFAISGSPDLRLPTASGTFVTTATSPLSINATSGLLALDTAAFVRSVKKQIFTADGTYTPSTGMIYCIIEAVAGGGGGGGCVGNLSGTGIASGGGAGSYSWSLKTAADIGASKTIDIGTGGNGGAAGNNAGAAGADTTVGGTFVVAKGGGGGAACNGLTTGGGGAGGVAGTGDIAIPGEIGSGAFAASITTVVPNHGHGANTRFGSGGSAALNSAGGAGSGYGSGGAPGGVYGNATDRAGGNGAPGIVVITEFCNQ